MKPSKYSGKSREYTKWGKNFKEVRVPGKAPEQPARPQLQIEAAEPEASGVYSNLAVITHTDAEFCADFLFAAPGARTARVGARVLLTPLTAKAIALALHDNLRRYELRFGPVKG